MKKLILLLLFIPLVSFGQDYGKETVVYETPTNLQTAEEYFNSAFNKENLKDYYGAIADYTKAI